MYIRGISLALTARGNPGGGVITERCGGVPPTPEKQNGQQQITI
jgi:hypothetical protein